jgi:hypothetical protein
MVRSAPDAEYERSIAMCLHATAVEGLKHLPDVTVKWVQASELHVSADGILRDADDVRVRCVWKTAPWRYLCTLKPSTVTEKLFYSPDVHVYQVNPCFKNCSHFCHCLSPTQSFS